MTKKKTSFLPKVEVLIILVFFLSFMVWAVSKCSQTKALYQTPEVEDTEGVSASTSADTSISSPPATDNNANNNATTISPKTTVPPPRQNRYSRLYVTIDGLNMRTGPSLDSTIILKLKLFEQVDFMNEVTDSTYQISLGYEIADEPWVKVRHKRGRVGWVYGAGVNYYKKKRMKDSQ